MSKAISVAILSCCFMLTACDQLGRKSQPSAESQNADARPDPPKPDSLPNEKWELYAVKSYESLEQTYVYNPIIKRTDTLEKFRITLRNKASVQLAMTCAQWLSSDDSQACGQGILLPNEKVWTKEGTSGQDLWIYSSQPAKSGLKTSQWHIDRRQAK
jgi:hypothetical protein